MSSDRVLTECTPSDGPRDGVREVAREGTYEGARDGGCCEGNWMRGRTGDDGGRAEHGGIDSAQVLMEEGLSSARTVRSEDGERTDGESPSVRATDGAISERG